MGKSIGEILAEKGSEIFAIGSKSSVPEAASLMTQKKIGLLIVLDENKKFVGILSERDIIRAVAVKPEGLAEMQAGQLVTKNIVACDPKAKPDEIISVMKEKGFRHMPVIKDGKIKGIITRNDLMAYLSS